MATYRWRQRMYEFCARNNCGEIIAWSVSARHLDTELEYGQGFDMFTAWTATHVLIAEEYDGNSWVTAVLRNPTLEDMHNG